VLEAAPRIPELAAALLLRQPREAGGRDRVRATDEALPLEGAGLVPGDERQLEADLGPPPPAGGARQAPPQGEQGAGSRGRAEGGGGGARAGAGTAGAKGRSGGRGGRPPRPPRAATSPPAVIEWKPPPASTRSWASNAAGVTVYWWKRGSGAGLISWYIKIG